MVQDTGGPDNGPNRPGWPADLIAASTTVDIWTCMTSRVSGSSENAKFAIKDTKEISALSTRAQNISRTSNHTCQLHTGAQMRYGMDYI